MFLAACDEAATSNQKAEKPAPSNSVSKGSILERDTEAPEVFQKSDKALWDGRPSLGGVWVAHQDVETPERVRITNAANGKEVIGALFRRERNNPGPAFQLSSDAASALGVQAGTPTTLNVLALRKKQAQTKPDTALSEATPSPAANDATTTANAATVGTTTGSTRLADGSLKPLLRPSSRAQTIAAAAPAPVKKPCKGLFCKRKNKGGGLFGKKSTKPETTELIAPTPAEPEAIETTPIAPIGDPVASTSAAPTLPAPAVGTPPVATTPASTPAPASTPVSAGTGRYVQMGLFSVEANAANTLRNLKARGLTGKMVKSVSGGNTYWRVLAGPAATPAAEADLLQKVKTMGFKDAYFVKG